MRVSYFTFVVCGALIYFNLFPSAARAHRLEPISTEFAVPFSPFAGVVETTYELEREGPGESEQAIPEVELELGLFRRFQVNFGYPLLRVDEGPGESPQVVGGRIEAGARTLLLGSALESYAVSLQLEASAPTGPREVVGDFTEVGALVHVDNYLGERVRTHSNIGWETTINSGDEGPERVFVYRNAVVWMASLRWNPVLEVLGETDTNTGETSLAIQPEMIFWANNHLEVKVGVPVGLTSSTPDIGVRVQVAIIWGSE